MIKAPKSMRAWFAFLGIILWTGICLTGFANVNWLIYIPAAALMVAAIIGVCPSQVAFSKLLGSK